MAERLTGQRAVELRRERLRRSPLCVDCLRVGRVTLATVPDHIIPLAKGGSDTEDNIRCLCSDHHRTRTQEQFNYLPRQRIGPDGWPVS